MLIPIVTSTTMQYSNCMDEQAASRTTAGRRQPVDSPEAALVAALKSREPGALEAVYRLYASKLLSYLVQRLGNRSLAEDVLQEVMLAAWQGAGKFRGECRLYTWLLVIARSRAINAYNRQLAPQEAEVALEDLDPQAGDRPLPGQSDESASLAEALRCLPEAQRECLELVFFHGLSLEETARVQAVPEGTVKSRLHRAKSRLRELLKEGGGE